MWTVLKLHREQGSLFVVKRTIDPLHRLFLLNRSGIENFALDLSKDLLLQVAVLMQSQSETIILTI